MSSAGAGDGAAGPAPPALPAWPRAVAQGLDDFTGREWLLERVDAWLAGTRPRWLLTGPPGSGKSVVAARVLQVSAGQAPAGGLTRLGEPPVTHALFCQANNPWTRIR